MVKRTLKNNNRGGKNKTVKKIKRGGEIPDLLDKTYFITNDEFIKSELLKLNIKQPEGTIENSRESLFNMIKDKNLCKENSGLNSLIIGAVRKEIYTIVYIINGNDK